ncbi:MAG: flagellar export chaperone FliS [Deltaproteobacteria bacterium]|jgi:flagellar protein FliS|nr:flagellar export chaperone FliS [Deltaproteobacteria bacterium]
MVAKGAFDQYKRSKIITATGVELIVQLYDECIRNVQLAKVILSKGNKLSLDEIKNKSKNISKSLNIVTGLADSLDMERGGEIAVNLSKLYEFVNMRLLNANLNNDPVMLDDALRVLYELRAAWEGILKQESKDKQKEANESQEKLAERFPTHIEGNVSKTDGYNRLAIKT